MKKLAIIGAAMTMAANMMAENVGKTYTLTNSFGRAVISERGANVISYVPAGGEEVFLVDKAADLTKPGWSHCGVPICWPHFNMSGGEGSIQHGMARTFIWRMMECENGADKSRAVFTLGQSPTIRKLFPHDFKLTYTVELGKNLTMKLEMENTGKEAFKVKYGLHPYFRIFDLDKITLEGCGEENRKLSAEKGLDGVLRLPQLEATIVDEGLDRKIRIESPDNQKTIVWNMGFTSSFGYQSWSRNYLCVEPVVGPGDDFATLAAGERRTLTMKVTVEKLSK